MTAGMSHTNLCVDYVTMLPTNLFGWIECKENLYSESVVFVYNLSVFLSIGFTSHQQLGSLVDFYCFYDAWKPLATTIETSVNPFDFFLVTGGDNRRSGEWLMIINQNHLGLLVWFWFYVMFCKCSTNAVHRTKQLFCL